MEVRRTSAHSVVKLPALRCAVKELAPGFAAGAADVSPKSEKLQAAADELRAVCGDSIDATKGVFVQLESIISLFDGRFGELAAVVAVPLKSDAEPSGCTVVELPASEAIELRYPAKRNIGQVLEDVYKQTVAQADKARKRDPGKVLRFVETQAGGWLVQVQLTERAA